MKKSIYIMEHEREADRLILQVDAEALIEKNVSTIINKHTKHQLFGKQRLLEAGCGPGHLTEAIAKKYPKLNIVGVDTSERRLSVARIRLGNYKRIELKNEDITCLQEESNRFDFVFSRFVLEHIKSQQLKAVSEFYRILKPGGVLILQSVDQGLGVFYPENAKIKLIQYALNRALRKNNYDPNTGRRLKWLAEHVGFKIQGSPEIECYKQFSNPVNPREMLGLELKLSISSPVFQQAFLQRRLADKVRDYLVNYIQRPDSLMYSILVTIEAQKPSMGM